MLLTFAFACDDPVADRAAPATVRIRSVNADGTGPYPTIQAAVDSAAPGDTIDLAPGLYTRTNQNSTGPYMVTVWKSLLIRGARADSCIVDAQFTGGGLLCQQAGAVALRGLTIRNTRGRSYLDAGGGVKADEASPLTIHACVFVGNNAPCFECDAFIGGAVRAHTVTVRDSEFHENSGDDGGAILAVRATIERCRFVANRTSQHGGSRGGAVRARSATISDCLFERNAAGLQVGIGGAVAADSGVIAGCTFLRNSSGADGLGSSIAFDTVGSVFNSVFLENFAAGYAAFVIYSRGHVDVVGCTFAANVGQRYDWGHSVWGSTGTVSRSIIAFGQGRPIANTLAASCNCVFANTNGDSLGPLDLGGNFLADPRFCATDSIAADTSVPIRPDSPCAPGNHPSGNDCGRIGAGPVGCGGPVSSARW
jgi:hypothetical protein